MKIDCQIEEQKKVKAYALEGELDVHQAKELKSRLAEDLEEGAWTYILHMDRVQYLDSSGLGMLVYLKKEILRHGGKLRIDGLKDTVLNVFKLTKLDDFFELNSQ